MIMTDTPARVADAPSPARRWLEVACGKCGRHLQVEVRPEDRYGLARLRHRTDPDYFHGLGRGPLGCPWCHAERGGFYDLDLAQPRPPRDWELYKYGDDEMLAHVPGEGWLVMPLEPGGYARRAPAPDETAARTMRDPDVQPITSLWDADDVDRAAVLGWPPFAADAEQYRLDQMSEEEYDAPVLAEGIKVREADTTPYPPAEVAQT